MAEQAGKTRIRNGEPNLGGRSQWLAVLAKLGPLIGLIFVWGLFALLVGNNFIRWPNQSLMLLQTAVVGTAAVGATLIIISGGIDLSVGSTIAVTTIVVALIHNATGSPVLALIGGIGVGALAGGVIGAMVIGHVGRVLALAIGATVILSTMTSLSWPLSILLGVLAAVAILALNEFFIHRIELAPFIVTLGMWGALRGAAKGLGDNQPVYPHELDWLSQLLETRGHNTLLPIGVWILLAVALIAAGLLRYTRFGRHVFAIGSNERTAHLVGINVPRTKMAIYIIGIGCAGIAGVLQFSYLNMGDPTTAEGYELKVIAAVVIGGASLAGGTGSILGTIVGALIMTVVDNGCTKLALDNWVQEIVTGGIIVAAVALDQLRHRRSN